MLGRGLVELLEYFRILRRKWPVIVAAALIGAGVAAAACLLLKPTYTAETQLFVAIQSSGSASDLQQGNTFGQARVQSYVKTVTTPMVLQPAIDSLGIETTPDELARNIKATADLNTVLITIAVSGGSAAETANVAQAVADSLVRTVVRLETPGEGGTSPVRLSIVRPATAPASPSAPDVPMSVALGLVIGGALGILVAVCLSRLDTRLRGEKDVRQITELPILGTVAHDVQCAKKPLITQIGPWSPRAESFVRLRTNLQFAHVSHDTKTVLVTSSLSGEGKTTTAVSLAISLAQSGQRVVLVDADLRRPKIADLLGLEGAAGLTTALLGDTDVGKLLQPWGEDALHVLTSGAVPPNPNELLGSKAMARIVHELEASFDAVIIDSPPLLAVADAAVLAQQAGGVVLVIGNHKVKRGDLQKSLEALSLVSADTLGLVLNRLPVKGPDAYTYESYTYGGTNSPAVPDHSPALEVTLPAVRHQADERDVRNVREKLQ